MLKVMIDGLIWFVFIDDFIFLKLIKLSFIFSWDYYKSIVLFWSRLM